MKANYDFSKARRGAVVPSSGSKTRITIRLDRDLVAWFKSKAEVQGEAATRQCSMMPLGHTPSNRISLLRNSSGKSSARNSRRHPDESANIRMDARKCHGISSVMQAFARKEKL